jgi:flagellar hook protein FlgE
MQHVLGIATQADDPTLPGTFNFDPPQSPGVTLTSDGAIQILGNTGTLNNIQILPRSFQVDGAELNLGFVQTASANGESALTDFPVFDSLGDRVNVKMTAVLESRTASTSTYRYYFESPDDSGPNSAIGTGVVVFDGEGKVIEGDTVNLAIARDDTAASTMQFRVSLSDLSGIVAQSDPSNLSLEYQNGSPAGTLVNFVIDEAGIINGVYDNGIIRTLGQIALGRFPNPQGLLESGGGTYREGVSSGTANVVAAGTEGAGTIRAGAIELSNTDIGRNLVDLIVASTNYRGNARVISSVQQLVDELLVLGR